MNLIKVLIIVLLVQQVMFKRSSNCVDGKELEKVEVNSEAGSFDSANTDWDVVQELYKRLNQAVGEKDRERTMKLLRGILQNLDDRWAVQAPDIVFSLEDFTDQVVFANLTGLLPLIPTEVDSRDLSVEGKKMLYRLPTTHLSLWNQTGSCRVLEDNLSEVKAFLRYAAPYRILILPIGLACPQVSFREVTVKWCDESDGFKLTYVSDDASLVVRVWNRYSVGFISIGRLFLLGVRSSMVFGMDLFYAMSILLAVEGLILCVWLASNAFMVLWRHMPQRNHVYSVRSVYVYRMVFGIHHLHLSSLRKILWHMCVVHCVLFFLPIYSFIFSILNLRWFIIMTLPLVVLNVICIYGPLWRYYKRLSGRTVERSFRIYLNSIAILFVCVCYLTHLNCGFCESPSVNGSGSTRVCHHLYLIFGKLTSGSA